MARLILNFIIFVLIGGCHSPDKAGQDLKNEDLDSVNLENLTSIKSAYYINLDRSPDRKKYMEDQNKKISKIQLTRFSAIDGQKFIDWSPTSEEFKYENNGVQLTGRKTGDLSKGVIANHLSFYHIWQEIKDNPPETISMIMEDDAYFREKFEPLVARYLANAPKDWDIIYLWCNRLNGSCNGPAVDKKNLFTALNKKGCYPGNVAQLIKSRAAKQYTESFFPISQPSDVRVDTFFTDPNFHAYCVTEFPVCTGALSSTLGHKDDLSQPADCPRS